MATATWKVQTGVSPPLAAVAFVNACSGLVVGLEGSILTTTDGGTQWIPRIPVTTEVLRDVAAIGFNQAWAVGDEGTIVSTVDGGDTFTVRNPEPK